MKIDDIISLENGKDYGLLLESVIDDVRYFLAVLVDKEEKPLDEYIVLEEVVEDDETYVRKINDPLILNQLMEDYSLQLEDLEDE